MKKLLLLSICIIQFSLCFQHGTIGVTLGENINAQIYGGEDPIIPEPVDPRPPITITVKPSDICFDYEPGSLNDASAILNSDGTPSLNSEWSIDDDTKTIVYGDDQINRKIRVRFNVNYDQPVDFRMRIRVVSGSGIGSILNCAINNYTNQQWVTISLNGAVPNSINLSSFEWEWGTNAWPTNYVPYNYNITYTTSNHSYKTVSDETVVEPDEILFDNDQGGFTLDALTLNDGVNILSAPEWKSSEDSRPFAYVQNQTNRVIKVKFKSYCADLMNLKITLKAESGTPIGYVTDFMVNNYKAGDWVTINLNGAIPAGVNKTDFTWSWVVTAMPINSAFFQTNTTTTSTSHTYYTVYDTPKLGMANPWINVLDYVCVWAAGKTDKYDILRDITTGIYNDLGIVYSVSSPHTGFNGGYFNLSSLLYMKIGDCSDMAALVQVFSNALGIQDIKVKKINGYFAYKLIKPIGKDVESDGWDWHQVACLCEDGVDYVYDACIMHDQFNFHIPIHEGLNSDYKSHTYQSGVWIADLNYIDLYTKID